VARAVAERGGFGGEFSRAAASSMFARLPEAIDDVKAKTRVVAVAPRTWHIVMPIVNAVLFETDAGLVLVDTGMAPAGPAILQAIRSVSDKPLHTVIYTHGHVDHAYGTWALLEAGEKPQIVAQRAIMDRFERYVMLRGSLARYMNQPPEHLPRSLADIALPTRLFDDALDLEIGGEHFVLKHHRGETDDQLYVWAPARGVLASADYYQGFLPNAGNGKRVQRHVRDWIEALREMAALQPRILLPAHGAAMQDPPRIARELTLLADALQSIREQTLDGLNRGLRKDQVVAAVQLPEALAREPSLRNYYVSAQDIAKMIVKEYTGWWDDLPADWTPSTPEEQAAQIAELAGGTAVLERRARELVGSDVRMASHLAQWAWLAAPDEPAVQQLVIDVFGARILDPRSLTQETLVYLDIMAEARQRQLAAAR
jgi:alkyl sulfatase BDS1-like metallo-beta-lactamase superfamily hydrolase